MLLRTILNDHDEASLTYYQTWGEHTLLTSGISDLTLFPLKYLSLLESMQCTYVEPDYIFVHAGLDMSKNAPILESDSLHMLWSRRTLKVDTRRLGGRQLVTGHMIRMIDDIRKSINSAHIRIDNGAFTQQLPEMGNLVALNLDTKELILQPWCDGDEEEIGAAST